MQRIEGNRKVGVESNSNPQSAAEARVLIESWHGGTEDCVRVCLCSSLVTVVQKLNCIQASVTMRPPTTDYNNQQSLAGQLLSTTIIFPIQR